MLQRLLGKGLGLSSGGKSQSGTQHPVKRSHTAKHQKNVSMDDEREIGAIKRTMDEDHFASGMPKEHPSLSDKLDSHRAGTLFKYAVITNAPSEGRTGMFSKLRSYTPQTKVDNLTLNNIPPIRLIGDSVNFPLRSAVDPKLFQQASDFMLIDCVMVHFVPLDSFANDKSVVAVQINDFRKVDNTVARSAKIDNTMGYNLLFCLDYCIETRDADKLTLSFSCPSKNFQAGISWATVKVVAQLQFLSFPKRLPLVETLGVSLFSDTDLDEFQCDPRELDLVWTPNALKRLKETKQRGEVENLTMPKDDKQEVITAKTILGESPDNEDIGSQIGRMKELALLRERQNQAKMKNREKLESLNLVKFQHKEDDSSPVEDKYSTLGEPSPEESASVVGTILSSTAGPSTENKGKRVVKFSG